MRIRKDTDDLGFPDTMFHFSRNPRVYEKLRQEVLPIDMQHINFDELKGPTSRM